MRPTETGRLLPQAAADFRPDNHMVSRHGLTGLTNISTSCGPSGIIEGSLRPHATTAWDTASKWTCRNRG